MILRLFILVLLVAALLVPGSALAGASNYEDAVTPGAVEPPGGAQGTAAAESGALPFTGLNLGLIVAGGAVLLASGLVLRRRGRSSQT